MNTELRRSFTLGAVITAPDKSVDGVDRRQAGRRLDERTTEEQTTLSEAAAEAARPSRAGPGESDNPSRHNVERTADATHDVGGRRGRCQPVAAGRRRRGRRRRRRRVDVVAAYRLTWRRTTTTTTERVNNDDDDVDARARCQRSATRRRRRVTRPVKSVRTHSSAACAARPCTTVVTRTLLSWTPMHSERARRNGGVRATRHSCR